MRFAMKTFLSAHTGLAPLVYIDAEARPVAWAIHNALLHQNRTERAAKADHMLEITDVLYDVRARTMDGQKPQVHAMWRKAGQASYDWWLRRGEELIHVPALCAVAILAFRDGKIATVASVKREGRIGLPAGGVEFYENPVQAAIRELGEETGLIVGRQGLTFLGATKLEDRDTVGLFLAPDAKGELQSSEEGEAAWLAPEELTGPRSVFAAWNLWALSQHADQSVPKS